jgi:GAF domain-containing protein
MPHKYLLKEFEDFARAAANVESLMSHMSQRVHSHIPRYNWVGFYLVDKKDSGTLILGPHTGSFAPNPKISLHQGLCGLAASKRQIIVADDVTREPHYLRASDLVKSQIAVPLLVGEKMVAVFNVESYFISAFKPPQERSFVESCARIAGSCFEKKSASDFVNA